MTADQQRVEAMDLALRRVVEACEAATPHLRRAVAAFDECARLTRRWHERTRARLVLRAMTGGSR